MGQPIIGIMGPGEGATTSDIQIASDLGRQIAQAGWILLTGGRNAGVMDAACRGAKSANGLTIGILPGSDRQHCSNAVDIPILTGMGNGRNPINVLTSDVVIACGMGAGTAAEVALAIKTKTPVILVNTSEASQAFWQSLSDQVWVATNGAEAIAIVKQLLSDQKLL